ncbi:uncharacterized protein LOC107038997 [Diachasma alloeum]|uniref:uncharacterized protein LOC107038997 n=1 Tax=Diachasma alloeum TaxID=454923 RepID=UPI00073815A4|nr:uncharacterized protein LOC107038997 [Diachasma alloeum]
MLSTPTRMNVFLQRMLRKNDDECETEIIMETNHQQVEYSPRSKSKWMRKFGASPSKNKSFTTQSTTPTVHRTDPMPIKRATTLPTPQEAEDLGKIIHEFEINYLSPTKQITQQEAESTGKFVKKMVAAFEQKYKSFKNPENETDENRWKRRSLPTVSERHQEARNNFFNETYLIKPLDDSYVQSLHEDDLNVSYNALDETVELSRSSFTSIDVSRTSFSMENELSSTPMKIQANPPRPRITSPPDPPSPDERTPKIVGAFLKKPIEVEDTSIDWIPITGKKLPRKHSFKKLLSILTGRKFSNKGSKLFCSQSQTNLPEETSKEHHDSGYDEKSSSTSSLTSLASFTDILQHQETYVPDADKRTVSTFQAPKETENSLKTVEDDIYSDTLSVTSKKLVFEEIPRSEVRLSLGPSFPLKATIMRQASGSSIASGDINDFHLDSDNDTPVASPLPKHPYVSSKDNLDDSAGLSSEDVTQVELRNHSWKFIDDTLYDTPRSYLSRSEPGLYNSPRRSSNWSFEAHVYDIPTVKVPPRPKSSVYEDALSLKRRNAYVGGAAVTSVRSEFYAFQQEEEPHYATVKPRNIKILPSRDLLRSMGDISPNCRGGTPQYRAFNRLAGF